MIKAIFKPLYLLISLFLIQASVLWVFWYAAVPISIMNTEKQDQIYNPYLSEMNFKDDLQKSYYEESWFPKQTEKVVLMVFSNFGLNDLVYCKKKIVKECNDFNFSRIPFQFYNKIMQTFYDDHNENIVLTQINQDYPLHEEYKLQSLLTGNYIGFRDFLNNSFNSQTDFDSLLYQSNKYYKGQSYLLSDINDEIVQHINQDHFNDAYFKNETNIKQQLLQLQKQEGQSFTFYYQRINETFLYLQNHFQKNESNSDQIIQDYFNEIISLTLDSFNQTKNLNSNITIFSVGQYGLIPQQQSVMMFQNQSKGFILAYDNRKFFGNKLKSVVQNHYEYQITSYDISATISALTGQPLTKNNIGIMIPQYFLDLPFIDNYILANNFYTNYRHVEDLYNQIKNKERLFAYEELDGIEQLTQQVRRNYKNLFINDNINNQDELYKFLQTAVIYIQEIRTQIKQEMIYPKYDNLNLCFNIATLNLAALVVACCLINYYQQQITTHFQFKKYRTLLKILIFVLIFIILLSSLLFTIQGFSVLILLICGTVDLAILYKLTFMIYNKEEPLSIQIIKILSFAKKQFRQINFDNIFDIFVFISALILVFYSQISQENMSNYSQYIRIFLLVVNIVYYLYFSFLCVRRNSISSADKKIYKNVLISLIVFTISIYLQQIFSQNQKLFNQFQFSDHFKMILSSVIHLALFFYLTIKQIQSINKGQQKVMPKHLYFFYFVLQSILILFSLAYYLCFYVQDYSDNDESSLGLRSQQIFIHLIYLTFIILCLYQFFVFNSLVGKLWNCSSLLVNFTLMSISSLDQNSFIIVQLFVITLISYNNIVYTRQQICYHSKYLVLFLLSITFFISTGHSYKLNDLFQLFLSQSSPFQQNSIAFLFRALINILAGFIYACLILPFYCIIDTSLNFQSSQDLNYQQKSLFEFVFDCSNQQNQQNGNSFQILETDLTNIRNQQTQSEEICDSPKHKALKTHKHILDLTFSSSNLKFQLPIFISLVTLIYSSAENLNETSSITHLFPGIMLHGLVYLNVNSICLLQYLILKYDQMLLKQFKIK